MAAGLLADQAKLRLITAVDERSAAFLALGLATASGRAVAVVTTSGTAVANLLPAVVEADRSNQPLLLLTADRPLRLKRCGANQTVNQEDFLQPACRWVESPAPEGLHDLPKSELENLATEAWRYAHAPMCGPVQLNLAFEEPLHASHADQLELMAAANQRVLVNTLESRELSPSQTPPTLNPDRPGVVVAGPWRGLLTERPAYQRALHQWLERTGWPLLADPLAALPAELPGRIAFWDLQLDHLVSSADLQVLRLGPLPASRRLERWLAAIEGPQILVSEGEERSLDPLKNAQQWSGGLAAWVRGQTSGEGDGCGRFELPFNDALVDAVLDQRLPLQGAVNEPALSRYLARLLPAGLPVMLSASSPVRDWLTWSGRAGADRPCFSFRGASGIDGTLSLAMGLSLELGRTVLITGDLALLHDSNGWLHASTMAPPLLVLLIDNNGGGIFQQLPIDVESTAGLDRLFAMPQDVDQLALAAAHGVPGRNVAVLEDLPSALEWGLAQPGPALLRCCTDRDADARLRTALRTAAQNADPLL